MEPSDDPAFTVDEVATVWPKPWPVRPGELLTAKFEDLIEQHRQRGYRLHSWQLHRLVLPEDRLNETIVAVFQRT